MAKNHDLHARRWRSRESLPKLPLSACFGRAADGSLESSSREVLQQFRLECLAEARSSVQSFLQRERELMARLPGSLGGANEEAAALFSEVAAFRAAALRERARLQVASLPYAALPPPLPVRFRSPPPSSSQHSLPVQRVCWACDGMLRERLQRTSSPGSGVAAADVSGGAWPDADADPSPHRSWRCSRRTLPFARLTCRCSIRCSLRSWHGGRRRTRGHGWRQSRATA